MEAVSEKDEVLDFFSGFYWPGRLLMKDFNARTCPKCKVGRLEIALLQKGCRCCYCHKLIESDYVYGASTVGRVVMQKQLWSDWICSGGRARFLHASVRFSRSPLSTGQTLW
jgi:hypothetical protein